MKRKKHVYYELTHTIIKGTAVVGLSLALATFSSKSKPETIPYTQEDLNNNIIFSSQLREIMSTTEYTFENEEIYNLLIDMVGEPLTSEKLAEISEIEINKPLTNSNLSDLKYLPNLLSIQISDNTVDFEDLQYNQNLYYITASYCTLKNTDCIPNTTELLTITYSTCDDNRFMAPYYCRNLYLEGTTLNNLTFKNPSYLESLSIVGDTILDLNSIAGCTNLQELNLLLCSNITNPSALTKLSNLKTMHIDDYCPIWLTNEVLDALPLSKEEKVIYGEEITKLDKIASDLVVNKDTVPEEYKIQNIVLYILEKLKYDMNVAEDPENTIEAVQTYNLEPITSALNEEEVVCINYACLFKALANRVKLENYQLYSKIHSWNIVKQDGEFKGYDLTNLDIGPIVKMADTGELCLIEDMTTEEVIEDGNGPILYYYEFNLDELTDADHLSKYTPTEVENMIINIGYINENSLVKLIHKNEEQQMILSKSIRITLFLLLLEVGVELIQENKKEKKLILEEPMDNEE